MAHLLTMFVLLLGNTDWPREGLATYYAKGLIEQVYNYRLTRGQVAPCPECLGYVALLWPEDIGRKVYLARPGEQPHGPYLVVDCAEARVTWSLLLKGWVVDVGYEIALRWQMRGPLSGVRVSLTRAEPREPRHILRRTETP